MQEPLPLLVGAKGERMLGVVARRADQWNRWSTPAEMRVAAEVLARHCDEIGRDPASIHRSTQALVMVTDDAAAARAFVEAVAPARRRRRPARGLRRAGGGVGRRRASTR